MAEAGRQDAGKFMPTASAVQSTSAGHRRDERGLPITTEIRAGTSSFSPRSEDARVASTCLITMKKLVCPMRKNPTSPGFWQYRLI